MVDVCDEALAIRRAMADLGWRYYSGGPYPHAPTLAFRRGGETLRVKLGPVEIPTDIKKLTNG